MGAEVVNDEKQDPVYFAEPGKPPSKTPLMSYYFPKHVLIFKNKIMHVLFFDVTPCHPKTILENVEWPILLLYSRI